MQCSWDPGHTLRKTVTVRSMFVEHFCKLIMLGSNTHPSLFHSWTLLYLTLLQVSCSAFQVIRPFVDGHQTLETVKDPLYKQYLAKYRKKIQQLYHELSYEELCASISPLPGSVPLL